MDSTDLFLQCGTVNLMNYTRFNGLEMLYTFSFTFLNLVDDAGNAPVC